MTRRLILIVGIQKSGTTLLSRLLQETELAGSPFRSEGNDFFGNEPPFVPDRFPAGAVYQRVGREQGHEIGAEDATEEVRQVLRERLAAIDPGEGLILNKNPYNTVRLPWLRALFPNALLVAMVRQPVANVYSLAKKYIPHKKRGQPPDDDGWWGVKPAGWLDLSDEDRLIQCARQWNAVNLKLARDRQLLDRIIPYHALCADPARILIDLYQACTGEWPERELPVTPLRCFDDEFSTGSRLRSKNRYYKERGNLDTPDQEKVEFPPLEEAQAERILEITADANRAFPELP